MTPEWFEQRIPLEERDTRESCVGGDLEPLDCSLPITELGENGAYAVRDVMIPIRAGKNPLDEHWDLVENTQVVLAGELVTLDFAVVARTGKYGERGIAPGQAAVRGSGTRFCVSGPFPDEIASGQAATVEQIINGVVVDFVGVAGNRGQSDIGVWDNPARLMPLFP